MEYVLQPPNPHTFLTSRLVSTKQDPSPLCISFGRFWANWPTYLAIFWHPDGPIHIYLQAPSPFSIVAMLIDTYIHQASFMILWSSFFSSLLHFLFSTTNTPSLHENTPSQLSHPCLTQVKKHINAILTILGPVSPPYQASRSVRAWWELNSHTIARAKRRGQPSTIHQKGPCAPESRGWSSQHAWEP